MTPVRKQAVPPPARPPGPTSPPTLQTSPMLPMLHKIGPSEVRETSGATKVDHFFWY